MIFDKVCLLTLTDEILRAKIYRSRRYLKGVGYFEAKSYVEGLFGVNIF